MDEFLGIVKIFAGTFAPRGWAFCDGSILPIAQNTALFSLLGTTFGGNGNTTFALPDLRGRVPISPGQGPGLQQYVPGQVGGTENVTLTLSNLPPHVHPLTGAVQLPCNGNGSDTDNPEGAYPASPSVYSSTGPQFMGDLKGNLAVGSAGSGLPFSNREPYLAIYYIICTEGIYPSRN